MATYYQHLKATIALDNNAAQTSSQVLNENSTGHKHMTERLL